MFNGTVCPNCSLDREKPDAVRLADLKAARANPPAQESQVRAAQAPVAAWWEPWATGLFVIMFAAMVIPMFIKPDLFTGLSLAAGVVTGFLAQRKGYNFCLWAMASGVVGLIVLAFLPFANAPEQTPKASEELRERGHLIAGVLTLIGVMVALVRFLG